MPNINALIVAWWAWWSVFTQWSYVYWWGWWWAGWLLNPLWAPITFWSNPIVVWAWWAANTNWANSSALWYTAIWWGTWWIWSNVFWQASSWANWWSWGWAESNSRWSPANWWLWTAWQWYNWWWANSATAAWGWGWGWAWWVWWFWWAYSVCWAWWVWKQITIWWIPQYYAWWGWGWASNYYIGIYWWAQWIWWLWGWWGWWVNWTNWLWGWGWGWTNTLNTVWWSWVVKLYFLIDWSQWVWVSSTWWTITQSWWYQIHTFTSSWTFNAVASVVPPVISTIPDVITWYWLTWTLPTWASFDNVTWIISWTSLSTWTYPLVFSATNSSWTTTKNFNLIINSPIAPVMWVIADIVINSWDNINKDFSLDVTQTNQDPILDYALVWTLPLWLTFNSITWVLSWNPTQVWTFNYSISARDKDWISNHSSFNIIINKWTEKYNEPWFFDLIANSFN